MTNDELRKLAEAIAGQVTIAFQNDSLESIAEFNAQIKQTAKNIARVLHQVRAETIRECAEVARTYGPCPDDRGCEYEISRLIMEGEEA